MTQKITKANPKQSFPDLESHFLHYWKEQKILEQSIEQRAHGEKKTFYDGPITANGMPHTGHMLTFGLKDLFPRLWTMQGYQVTRSLGWDCQGIPVEYEVEKKLGFSEKADIEKYGIEQFNELCRQSVLEFKENVIELEEKMGRLTTQEEEYHTMDASYIESIWWSLSELYSKNLLYEGFKVVPYSTRAGTSLSNAEVALGGYKKQYDDAITVKFELQDMPKTYVLAWTTTPWTIPTNLALAVNTSIEYVSVYDALKGETYIVAKTLVEKVMTHDGDFHVEHCDISSLLGKKYHPPFTYFVSESHAVLHTIVEGFHVTDENGTGIVHLAPYGKEDCEIFHQIGITPIDVLDSQGDFIDELIPEYGGMHYADANKQIIADLTDKNLLFKSEKYLHDMPQCWRTHTPLIYKPITSWYIAMSTLRESLLKNNESVNWIPKHVKHGRFGRWLEDVKDWGISRLRYWGTPLPIWKSESGKVKVIGSFDELYQLSGTRVTDPHRPYVDDITFTIDGEIYTRIPDVIDVWYDSGAMPFARFHYPFENKELFWEKFPAEYIAEGVDQTRGWFYSLLAISTALFDTSPYKNVIVNGFATDDKGYKLSKSKKNYSAPDALFHQFGADTIRMNIFSTPLVAGEDSAVSDKTLKRTMQEITLPLWNIHVYLTTYAHMHSWTPRLPVMSSSLDEYGEVFSNATMLQMWMLAKTNESIKSITDYLESYQVQKAMMEIRSLLDAISTWYIRLSRDSFAQGDEKSLEILYVVLVRFMQVLAPIAPFITEKIYHDLVISIYGNNVPQSIHLTDYPVYSPRLFDKTKDVFEKMKKVQSISSIGQKLRAEAKIKLRQPLLEVYVVSAEPLDEWMIEMVRQELNVKQVIQTRETPSLPETYVLSDSRDVALNTHMTLELENEGRVRDIIRVIQSERKRAGLEFGIPVSMTLYGAHLHSLQEFITSFQDDICKGAHISTITFSEIDTVESGITLEGCDVELKFNT